MYSRIRIGLLGAAKIAPNALIAPARQRDDMQVVCIAARDPSRAAAFAAEHGLEAVASYDALIERDDVDLVYVALPPAAHREWSMRALQGGKAVLCEKPFALSANEARSMVDTARECGKPLIEAFHYRYHQAMQRAVTIVRDGALGKIRSARAGFCTHIAPTPGELRWRADQGGGAVMDLGCYPVHALRSLIGEEPTVRTAAAIHERDVESEAWAVLDFPGGAQAQIRCSLTAQLRIWDLEVIGERGRLTLSNFIAPQFGGVLSLHVETGSRDEDISGATSYEAQLAHVADVLIRNAPPLTGGEDSIANMRVIDAIRLQARQRAPLT